MNSQYDDSDPVRAQLAHADKLIRNCLRVNASAGLLEVRRRKARRDRKSARSATKPLAKSACIVRKIRSRRTSTTEEPRSGVTTELLVSADPRPAEKLSNARRKVVFGISLNALKPVFIMCLTVALSFAITLFWHPTQTPNGGWHLQAVLSIGYNVSCVDFSPDGRILASGSDDGSVRLWNTSSHRQIGEPLNGHAGPVHGVTFSPDGQIVASAGSDKTILQWKSRTGQRIGEPLSGHTGIVWTVAFNPVGSTLASGGDDGTVRLWDSATGRQAGEPLLGHLGSVWSVAFSPDGRTLASAGWDRTVRLWDSATGRQIGSPLLGHTDAILSVAFSPDGQTLATASKDKTVRLWDSTTGRQIGSPLLGHTDTVWSVAFGPDGRTLATASRDMTVRLWAKTG
jgi:WD40 repeat protein